MPPRPNSTPRLLPHTVILRWGGLLGKRARKVMLQPESGGSAWGTSTLLQKEQHPGRARTDLRSTRRDLARTGGKPGGRGVSKPAFSPANRNATFATRHAPQQSSFLVTCTAGHLPVLCAHDTAVPQHSRSEENRCHVRLLVSSRTWTPLSGLMVLKVTLEDVKNTASEPSTARESRCVRVWGAGHPAQLTHLSRRVSCTTVRQPQSKTT